MALETNSWITLKPVPFKHNMWVIQMNGTHCLFVPYLRSEGDQVYIYNISSNEIDTKLSIMPPSTTIDFFDKTVIPFADQNKIYIHIPSGTTH